MKYLLKEATLLEGLDTEILRCMSCGVGWSSDDYSPLFCPDCGNTQDIQIESINENEEKAIVTKYKDLGWSVSQGTKLIKRYKDKEDADKRAAQINEFDDQSGISNTPGRVVTYMRTDQDDSGYIMSYIFRDDGGWTHNIDRRNVIVNLIPGRKYLYLNKQIVHIKEGLNEQGHRQPTEAERGYALWCVAGVIDVLAIQGQHAAVKIVQNYIRTTKSLSVVE